MLANLYGAEIAAPGTEENSACWHLYGGGTVGSTLQIPLVFLKWLIKDRSCVAGVIRVITVRINKTDDLACITPHPRE